MTIQQRNVDYEEHEAFKVDHIRKTKKGTIIKSPRIVKTKFTDEQVVMDIKPSNSIQIYTWWANWTSMNALIKKWGTDETKMEGKEVLFDIVKQPIDGVMREVIYIKGSYKKPKGD